MHSVFIILAVTNIYLMTFAFGRVDLGTGRPIIIIALFTISLLWMFEFAMGVKQSLADKRSKLPTEESREEAFRDRLNKNKPRGRRIT